MGLEPSRHTFPSAPHEADDISRQVELSVAALNRARDERDLLIAGQTFPTEEHREAFYDQEPTLHAREQLLAQQDATRARLSAAASQAYPPGVPGGTALRSSRPGRPPGRTAVHDQQER